MLWSMKLRASTNVRQARQKPRQIQSSEPPHLIPTPHHHRRRRQCMQQQQQRRLRHERQMPRQQDAEAAQIQPMAAAAQSGAPIGVGRWRWLEPNLAADQLAALLLPLLGACPQGPP
jgi:hypothetical protein